MKKASKKRQPRPEVQTIEQSEIPKQILLEDALKGAPFGKEILLGFYIDDVVVERDFYRAKGRAIPRLLFTIKQRVTVEVYGSHMETNEDLRLTHMVHNPTNFRLMQVPEFGRSWPPWVFYLNGSSKGWVVATDARSSLKGDAEKTVFQGIADDPDLHSVLGAVREIKGSKETFMDVIEFPGGIKKKERVGARLLDFLLPVIRNSDFKKLKLLEKCMKYLEAPTRTKLSRFTDCLRAACRDLDRLPTAPELYSRILDGGYELKEARFYKDLNDVGLGWLTRKNSSKTPFGRVTK
jgi:hypothetical protein